ncbi:MAG: sialidase family protein [Gemmatimonadaceae bacterium]
MKTPRLLFKIFVAALSVGSVACKGDAPKPASTAVNPENIISFGEPVPLTRSPSGGVAATYAFSPSGKLALSWITTTTGGSDGTLMVQAAAQSGFGAIANDTAANLAVSVKDPLSSLRIHGEAPPKLAYANDSVLYASYLVTKLAKNSKPLNALRFVASNDGGKTFGEAATVTPATVFGSYDDQSLLATANGNVWLSWIADGGNDTSHVYFAKSTDAGKSWSTPNALDLDASCSCCKTSFATGPHGELYVAWRKRFAGEVRDVVVAASVDGGVTWSKPVRVYADEWQVNYCTDAGPSLKVSKNGTIHIAWFTGRLGRAGTQYAQSADGAKTFSKPLELALAANSRPEHVQLVLGQDTDERTVLAVWDDGTIAVPQIVMRVSRDAGRSFSPIQQVSIPGMQAMYPTAVLRRDTVRVAWQERTPNGVTTDSLIRDKKHDKEDADANLGVVGSLQIVARQGVLSPIKSR